MSFFVTGFWIPSNTHFGTTFLDTGLNFVDSLGATLLCTLFSGIQLCMCRRIVQLHLRLRKVKAHRPRRQYVQGLFITFSSIVLTMLFLASALIYSVQFSRNVLSLRSVTVLGSNSTFTGAEEFILACTKGRKPVRCFDVPLEHLLQGRKMELAFSGLVQALLIITDLLLVLRCYFIFTDKPWVYTTALLSFLASIGVWLFGFISLSKTGGLSPTSSWNRTPQAPLPHGFSPSMSIISSLIVNAVVTTSIVARMLAARRRLKDSLPVLHGGGKDDVYTSAAAILTESALPPVFFGIVATVFAFPAVQEAGLAFEFNYVPKVAWLAFTALAPQLILVRILQGRAWGTENTFSANGALRSTQDTGPLAFGSQTNMNTMGQDDDGRSLASSKRSSIAGVSGESRDGIEGRMERKVKSRRYSLSESKSGAMFA